ncbi:monomeric sarcosine oxidase [Pleomorphomonas sp. SM30]|nr:monomeric sarcosine oxidase [Pleomorphomonas sp. SM30]
MKVLVVGAGIAGLSTAWALTRRGVQVEVFEQGPVPCPVATSYDEHRITRHAYGEMHGYARLMPAAFQVWDALFGDIGARHFEPMPVVVVQREDVPWLNASLADLDALHVGWRELPLASVPARYPMLETAGLSRVVETDGGGVLFPIRILTDLVRTLANRGVVFHPRHKVTAIDAERGTVTVNGREFSGDHVVIAAGAWLTKLVPDLAPVTVPSRQAVAFLAPRPISPAPGPTRRCSSTSARTAAPTRCRRAPAPASRSATTSSPARAIQTATARAPTPTSRG